MARPRKPTNVLKLRGAFKEHAARGLARANEPEPSGEIGEPPERLAEDEAKCWREIVGLAHFGTLCEADRLVLEYGSVLLAKLIACNWNDPALRKEYPVFLGQLGLTPSARSKVAVIKRKPTVDPYAEFADVG